jgi:anaerobic selenocysteine-containing dehydrogenase
MIKNTEIETGLRVLQSVCPLDCPDTCSLEVTFDGDRMVKLTGSDHPITRGFACVKMAKYPLRQERADRLLVPQKRVGRKGDGRFEPITWDDALDQIALRTRQNIDSFGPQSVLPFSYAGTMGLIERDYPLAFFRALGASELDWTICSMTGSAGWEANYGPQKLSVAPEDVVHSRLIVLWGINVLRSNCHLVPFLKEARHRGARIVHIDPYRNETSRFADQHWQVAVGSDAALALAIGGVILDAGLEDKSYLDSYANDLADYHQQCDSWSPERAATLCGIHADSIRELALAIGREPATFIKVGYGMTRNEGGGNAIRAITLLPALTGAWQNLGGGAALSTSGAFGLNTKRFSGADLIKPNCRVINQNHLGESLLTAQPPISTLFVFNSNPAAVAPDSSAVLRGLAREDLFTIVMDHFQTDTADYADILLPATTFLEHPDIYTAYGHYYLQWAEPVVNPRGQCKPNSWVFQQLAKRLSLTDEVLSWTTDQIATELLNSNHPHVCGITLEQLKAQRSIRIRLPDAFRPYANGSHFPDRKIRFTPAPEQIEFKVQPTDQYPLRLISPPGAFILNTSMGNIEELLKAAGGEPTILIHPDDAADANLNHGQRARIVSPNGSIVRKLLVTSDARQGVAIAVGQWWPKLAPDKKSLNELTSQELTDLGGGSLFGNAVVRIEAC